LEIGAGTGIATRQFAARGARITAVESDPAMAALASQRAASDGSSVDLVVSDFEHVEFEPGAFRLVFSATAWHWVTPGVRSALAAQALMPGGALAAFWNTPIWDGNPVRPAFDAAYASVAGAFAQVGPGPMNPTGDVVVGAEADSWRDELDPTPSFTDLERRTYRWTASYTRERYLGLLGTHSDHLLIGAQTRERLFAGLGEAIDAVGGSLELTYESVLCLARRA
ncbi:MAG: class I SAM-dependent methyltransferase, partial [Solirubrobacteraceae bacterium]